ncbi:phospholipase D-like domain-containing protein [Bacillus marasmi]|uniref:phospholipase D-like domain-containing protein n=1 Tax=Bacillus marasmi TaxID=1926279 RepID=UPI0011C86EB9|nr:phospholipase D-like domain-containing protein [Bacillus marasmi]
MDLKYVLMGLALLFVLFILLYIDYKFGRKSHLASSERKEYPVRSCQLYLFNEGPDLFKDMFQEIKNAKNHIHILFYIGRNDAFSKEFYSLLEVKAREGLEVRLLLDWVGSFRLSKQIIAELEAANVHFAFSHVPKFPFLFYKANVRNHRKIAVIDGKLGYLGGFNVGKEYIDKDPKLSPWRDYHMKLSGDIVCDLQTQFLLDWGKATKATVPMLSRYFPQSGQAVMSKPAFQDVEMSKLFEAPAESMNEPELADKNAVTKIQAVASEGAMMEGLFSNRIRAAQESIFIGTPYFIPSKLLLDDLLDAARRGVKITILVPHAADHMLVQEASYRFLRPLLAAGVEVYQFMNGFYHAKALVFDDLICDIGTTNFDQRSLFLNYEINCFITDKPSIAKIKNVIDLDLRDSKQLQLADLTNVSMMTKVKEVIARPLARFM